MLHLEDYLEMIEHLPQELRDRFTEMREMDLTVQNNTDALDKRARSLFQQCRKGELPTGAADAEFNAIRSDYYRVLEDSDEKIQLAGQMYDLVERYVRRLDTELYKFKCELEADHNGITEILEKRSLELDSNATSNGGTNQKENRFYDAQHSYSGTSSGRSDSRYKSKPVKRRESVAVTAAEKRAAAAAVVAAAAAASGASTSNVAPMMNAHIRPTTPGTVVPAGLASGTIVIPPAVTVAVHASAPNVSTYNLPNFSPAGNAIAAAASQAIAQTQQMQQGRRTASLKASYEAIGAMGSQELLINSELAGATHNALQAVERESSGFSSQRRTKKKGVTSAPGTANTIAAAAAGGVRGTTTTTLMSNNSIITPILTTTPTLPNQTPFAILGQQSATLQQQQQQQQGQVGTVQATQPLVQPQQQQQQQQQQKGPTLVPYIMGTSGPIAVQQQIHLHHSNAQVPLQHLQQVSHQQPMLQQLAVQQQQQQPTPQTVQQPTAMKPDLLPQQIQLGNIQSAQQKHILLPTTPQQQGQQRLPRPQQQPQQQFQQSLQSPQQPLTPQQPVPATSQQAGQQQQLPMQTLAQPQLMQAQAGGSHSLPMAQVQVQPAMKTRPGWKTITKPTVRRCIPGQTAQQSHIVHLQPQQQQQTQFQQIQQQQQQQHHHLQMVQQHLQQTIGQIGQHQLQLTPQQQQAPQQQQQQQAPQQQQQQQQLPQQLQISQQQQHHHQLLELPKDAQLQQTIQQQQQVLQQQQQILQQQQQLLQQQTQQQQPQLQVHHLIQQQQQLTQKQLSQQQQKVIQQQQQTQPQQQFVAAAAAGSSSSSGGVLGTATPAMELLPTASTSVASITSISSLDAGGRTESTKTASSCGVGSTTLTASSSSSTINSIALSESGMVVEQTPEGEWSYDPNEPRYCICNQVSYGDMVACDNEDCPFEWFHYPCVNITSSPKGKWYCPQCSSSMKRRASRKN